MPPHPPPETGVRALSRREMLTFTGMEGATRSAHRIAGEIHAA